MPRHASTVRPTRLSSVLLSLVPLAVCVAVPWALGLSLYPMATFIGVLAFLAYRLFVVRFGLCADHRRGIAHVRRGNFAAGLESFERSERVWQRRPFLDRYRAILLGSATAHRFHTLARYNQAYALSRLGRGEQALALLSRVLEDDPAMLPARELRDVLLAGSALHPEVGETMAGS